MAIFQRKVGNWGKLIKCLTIQNYTTDPHEKRFWCHLNGSGREILVITCLAKLMRRLVDAFDGIHGFIWKHIYMENVEELYLQAS